MSRNLSIVFSALFILNFVACDSGEDADFPNGHTPSDIPEEGGADAEPCSPIGSTLECDDECKGGIKECQKDGTLGPCVCPDGGSAGSSGTGGSVGSSGSGGSAGKAGSGGTGGSAGQAGSGGSAGSSGGSAGAGGSPPFSVECDQYGENGEVVVVYKAPLYPDQNDPGNVYLLAIGGWIKFPNGSPTPGTNGAEWCYGTPNKNSLVCTPKLDNGNVAQIFPGTTLNMWPAQAQFSGVFSQSAHPELSSAELQVCQNSMPEQPQMCWDYSCEETDCPVGTFVVCNGKDEVCGSRSGVLSGNMEYVDAPWVNLSCKVE